MEYYYYFWSGSCSGSTAAVPRLPAAAARVPRVPGLPLAPGVLRLTPAHLLRCLAPPGSGQLPLPTSSPGRVGRQPNTLTYVTLW